MRDLGYIEGQNIAFETRWAHSQESVLGQHAEELAGHNVDVLLVGNISALQAARQATKTIPIIMVGFGDAVGEGFVTSLAHPGGNITGISFLLPEISEKWIQLLRETAPTLSRVSVLIDPVDRSANLLAMSIRSVARTIGLAVDTFEARDGDELTTALAAIKKARSQALVAISSVRIYVHRARIAEFASKNRLPSITSHRPFAEVGFLMTYGPRPFDMFRRAATYVDKILKGARPGDLPIEQPSTFELVVNLKTAKALGLTIPQAVLVRADEIIR